MINVTTVNLPTHFEEIESSNDSRFQKVKIYIAHTGENLNKSIFSREVLENMIPSLSHIPILGLISEKDNGDKDFRGHEKNLSLEGGKFKIKFNTHAYGFVPEDNNAHFEITGGKEWLVTDGYLWTRFIDAIELFNDASGSKGQSMEVGDVEGYTDNRGRLVFTNAVFTGLCILGDDVPPAMTGSTVSTVFSKQDFKSSFEEMLAEFTAEKGEKALATKKKQNDEPAVATTVTEPESSASTEPAKSATPASSANTSSASKPAAEPAKAEDRTKASPASADSSTSGKASTNEPSAEPTTEEHEDVDDESAQMSSDKDDKDTNLLNKNESAFKKSEEDDEPDSDDAEDDKEDKKFACGSNKKKKKAQFELSLSDREHSLGDAVYQKYVDGTVVQDIWPVEIFEDYGIFRFVNWSDDNRQLFRITYSVNADDSIKLGDKTEIFSMYVTQEEKNKIEDNRAKLADLETKIAELTEYKNNIEMSEKETALESAKADLTAEQVKAIRGKFSEMSVEDVEKEIAYAMYSANKRDFSSSSKKKRGGIQTTNFASAKKSDFGYGTADVLFHK
ncbi:hypothetical protein [Limosilactobacillus reuteri]|uniref:hypothetical protein n=1 Tax=Limosilactobacillus reuteri TaxID=1598 RepID=UPI001C5A7E96|nr:hypothetical protein [Limosilactobacillus reuteri]MBW3350597.1 hypothetical protein [Limosilactobacillus reuteri]UUW69640.1 hypothetical protein NUJ10_11415 [Limosilactobacillus reuteri]